MNDKPIIRKVDAVGRISIPPNVLDKLHLSEGSSVLLYIENDQYVILKKNLNLCVFCGNPEVVPHSADDVEICADCRQKTENVNAIVEKRYEKEVIPNGRRLVIPFKIRNQLKIKTGDKMQIILKDGFAEMEKTQT